MTAHFKVKNIEKIIQLINEFIKINSTIQQRQLKR